MNETVETFDSIWAYCTANNRLVPMPPQWSQLYQMMKNTHQKPSGGCDPALPLILAAWHDTMPIEKQLRFKAHIEWALENHQLKEIGLFLRALPEEQAVKELGVQACTDCRRRGRV